MKNMSKTGISLETFFGFSDELRKIAAQVDVASSSRATGTSQVTKPVSTSTSKPKLPKLVSKPQQSPEIAPVQDHISSMKANPPPPVTMSSGGL